MQAIALLWATDVASLPPTAIGPASPSGHSAFVALFLNVDAGQPPGFQLPLTPRTFAVTHKVVQGFGPGCVQSV